MGFPPDVDDDVQVSEEAFERVKRESVSQLLMKAARLVNERSLAKIEYEPGQPRLRPSHTAVFPHLDLEGTRITTLAERLGVTKQAVSQLIGDLEAMGVVRRVSDPSDGRAKLVVFAEHGPTVLMRGMRVLQEMDAELETKLGADEVHALRATLLAIIDDIEG